MNLLRGPLTASLCSLLLLGSVGLAADEGETKSKPAAAPKDPPKEGNGTKPAAKLPKAETEGEPPADPRRELDKTVRTAPLPEAIEALEAALKEHSDDPRWQQARLQIVGRLSAEKRYAEALQQCEQLYAFQLAHLDGPQVPINLYLTVQNLIVLHDRLEQKQKGTEALDGALAALRKEAATRSDTGLSGAISYLLRAKTRRMAEDKDYEGADALLRVEVDAAQKARTEDPAAIAPLQTWARLMENRIDIAEVAERHDAREQLSRDLDATVLAALEQHPASAPHLTEFLRVRITAISGLMREKPEDAQALVAATRAQIEMAQVEDKAVIERSLKSLKSLEPRIEAALLLQKLVGQPAPEWDIETWAHGQPLPQESLRGKVVLLDFWAVWCGPCIATFPHLKSLYGEYHDQGLEIVGVTRQYGYDWNEEEQRAIADKEDATLETEVAMLDKFLAHHELAHPTIVTPKESAMYKAYGVSGIPHVVVIDRKGVIRLIRVGSGDANNKAIHAMVETLLKE